jgi:hypothetical protein
MTKNITKIYLNPDRSVKSQNDGFIGAYGNGVNEVQLIAPFSNQNTQYVRYLFTNNSPTEQRAMTLVGTEEVDGET